MKHILSSKSIFIVHVLKEERKQTESFISNNFNNHCKTHFNFQKDKDSIVFLKYLSIHVPDAFICKRKIKNQHISFEHCNQNTGYQTATELSCTHTTCPSFHH